MTLEAVTIEHALEVLNRIHAADPTVLPKLITYRAPCNQAVADDPTVQVGGVDKLGAFVKPNEPAHGYVVGVLGILNGFFGTDDAGRGPIAAHYGDDGRLDYFMRTPPPDEDG